MSDTSIDPEEDFTTATEAQEELTAQLIEQLEKLVKNNVAMEQDLIKQRVQPNPQIILMMRLNLLLDRLMGNGPARIQYEIDSAKNVQQILMHIQQEQAKAKLIIPELRPV